MTTQPATECTGIEIRPTADGPEVLACLCELCTGRRQVRERIARTSDVFLGAAAPASIDEEW